MFVNTTEWLAASLIPHHPIKDWCPRHMGLDTICWRKVPSQAHLFPSLDITMLALDDTPWISPEFAPGTGTSENGILISVSDCSLRAAFSPSLSLAASDDATHEARYVTIDGVSRRQRRERTGPRRHRHQRPVEAQLTLDRHHDVMIRAAL